MMFLLKAAFWLGLVLVLLPTGPKKQTAEGPQVSALDAASAASGAVSDLSRFCTRQPETCTVGSQVATILAQRAQDGAAMVYEFITERRETTPDKKDVVPVRHIAGEGRAPDRTYATGSIGQPVAIPAMPRSRPARTDDTLTQADRQPGWRQPELRREARLRTVD
jgi:hypothetical protein